MKKRNGVIFERTGWVAGEDHDVDTEIGGDTGVWGINMLTDGSCVHTNAIHVHTCAADRDLIIRLLNKEKDRLLR
jgi:hypothetical protein